MTRGTRLILGAALLAAAGWAGFAWMRPGEAERAPAPAAAAGPAGVGALGRVECIKQNNNDYNIFDCK